MPRIVTNQQHDLLRLRLSVWADDLRPAAKNVLLNIATPEEPLT